MKIFAAPTPPKKRCSPTFFVSKVGKILRQNMMELEFFNAPSHFYLRPKVRRCISANVRLSVCLSAIFYHFPKVRSWWNWYGRCILEKVVSGHRFHGWPIFGSTGRGDKLVIFSYFFYLLLQFLKEGDENAYIYMIFGTIRRYLTRNFEFLP